MDEEEWFADWLSHDDTDDSEDIEEGDEEMEEDEVGV